MRRLHTLFLSLVVVLIALGCSKNRASDENTQTTGTTAQQPAGPMDASSAQPGIDDLELGKSIDANKKVTDGTDDFSPKDTIYLSVKTDGAAADSEVKVRWTYGEQGQLVKEDSRKIPAGGEAWTEFHISKPSGFPKGDYQVTAFVNGAEKGTKRFEVK